MPDWRRRLEDGFARAGHHPDDAVLDELAQHAQDAWDAARTAGHDERDADAQVAALIAGWIAEGAQLTRRRAQPAAVEPPPVHAHPPRLRGLWQDVPVRRSPRATPTRSPPPGRIHHGSRDRGNHHALQRDVGRAAQAAAVAAAGVSRASRGIARGRRAELHVDPDERSVSRLGERARDHRDARGLHDPHRHAHVGGWWTRTRADRGRHGIALRRAACRARTRRAVHRPRRTGRQHHRARARLLAAAIRRGGGDRTVAAAGRTLLCRRRRAPARLRVPRS